LREQSHDVLGIPYVLENIPTRYNIELAMRVRLKNRFGYPLHDCETVPLALRHPPWGRFDSDHVVVPLAHLAKEDARVAADLEKLPSA
jgi:hypothetical protein